MDFRTEKVRTEVHGVSRNAIIEQLGPTPTLAVSQYMEKHAANNDVYMNVSMSFISLFLVLTKKKALLKETFKPTAEMTTIIERNKSTIEITNRG